MDDTRFYSFVAGLYLSPIQCGIQTAHAVSQIYADHAPFSHLSERLALYDVWAKVDKTIIVLNAVNAKGVVEAHAKLQPFAKLFQLPMTIFHEDADSLNGCPTAAGIVIPKKFYDVKFVKAGTPWEPSLLADTFVQTLENGTVKTTYDGTPEFEFMQLLRSYRLA